MVTRVGPMWGGSGDGFVRCSDGHVRWGRFGAAGVLFVVRATEGPLVMLQQRSAMAHEGGTWSCAGGAIDEGESAYDAALREASEEVGDIPAKHRVLGQYVFAPADDWTYTTLVVEVDQTSVDKVLAKDKRLGGAIRTPFFYIKIKSCSKSHAFVEAI